VTAFKLRAQNKSARPVAYRDMKTRKADPASLYMMETGIVILLFVIIHLLHFTLGALQPEFYTATDSEGRHDVYLMLIEGFKNGPYAIIYIVAMLALGYHLSHAIWSMLQTLGLTSQKNTPILRTASKGIAFALAAGYIAIPLSVILGILS
jgi:succinate dehydrogenase / fumarate reductase cytochrome b subunit